MSSTTTTPVEAGTTYPMPPKPSWATGSEIDDELLRHSRDVGTYSDIGARHDQDNRAVRITRSDSIFADHIEVGDAEISVGDIELYPAGARQLAALLIEAADLADQS